MFDEMQQQLQEVIKIVTEDLAMIKTGRAKPSLVEQVKIEAYPGTMLPLMELASITAPDPHMLIIQPWDQSVLKKVAAGLSAGDLHLNPVVDGNMIRIVIPPLTEERRRDLVKLVHQKIESGKEMVRNVRNETKRDIDGQKDDAGVSEDDIKVWLKQMQDFHDEFIDKLDELGKAKEAELMQI